MSKYINDHDLFLEEYEMRLATPIGEKATSNTFRVRSKVDGKFWAVKFFELPSSAKQAVISLQEDILHLLSQEQHEAAVRCKQAFC